MIYICHFISGAKQIHETADWINLTVTEDFAQILFHLSAAILKQQKLVKRY